MSVSFSSEKEFQESLKTDSFDWYTGYKRSTLYLELLNKCKINSAVTIDIGTGYGGPALAFSKSSLTIGMDVSKESVQIALKRAKIQKRSNLHLVFASGTQLPIKDSCADLAVLTGAFEFFPEAQPLDDPETTHLHVLKDVNRILKKHGALLLGIENRYWLLYWFGMYDFHSGLRFATILPRKWANFMCKKLKHQPYYLERLYSLQELTALLERAGFNIVYVGTILPNWMKSENIADINNKRDVTEKINAIKPWSPFAHRDMLYNLCILPKFFWKLLNSIGLLKFFCSNFIIIAKKS
jgi:ubiquinone/menaquinone biosynthesis C-methylase UbiE